MQKLKEGRGKAGTSTWMDQRKNVLADDGIHLAYNRNTKKKVTEFDLSCIETFISYPILDPNGELQFNVQYDDEADTYTNNLSELSGDYPYTLSKLLMATKTENVKKYIDEELTLLKHSHTKELDSLMGRLAGQKIIYGGTKAKQIFEPEYNQSIAIFGNSSIVRTFKPTNAPHFILSVTDLKLTYSPKREKMKIECFIAHVWV
eukprot:6945_1